MTGHHATVTLSNERCTPRELTWQSICPAYHSFIVCQENTGRIINCVGSQVLNDLAKDLGLGEGASRGEYTRSIFEQEKGFSDSPHPRVQPGKTDLIALTPGLGPV